MKGGRLMSSNTTSLRRDTVAPRTGGSSMVRARALAVALFLAAFAALVVPQEARAASKAELNSDAVRAYNKLIQQNKAARMLAGKAVAVLLFPDIVKAGFMFGGQIGEGVLLKGGKPSGAY